MASIVDSNGARTYIYYNEEYYPVEVVAPSGIAHAKKNKVATCTSIEGHARLVKYWTVKSSVEFLKSGAKTKTFLTLLWRCDLCGKTFRSYVK